MRPEIKSAMRAAAVRAAEDYAKSMGANEMERGAPIPDCPICAAYAAKHRAIHGSIPIVTRSGSVQPIMTDDGAAREALHEKADAVIKGIMDGSDGGLSRGKVDEIGRAVSDRQSRERRDAGLGRAIKFGSH